MRRIAAAALGLLGVAALLAVACSSGSSNKTTQIGDLKVNDHGTKDFSSQSTIALEADDFYFNPSFLKGTPGQTATINVTNESGTLHNISVPGLALDKDIPANGSASVDVVFPESGVLLYLCKYHSSQGMNGELLTGNATPQAASAAVVTPTLKVTSSATLGNILTDPAGRTLYIFKNDVPNSGKSAATGQTAVTWPPLTLASGNPVKPAGLNGDLALITRDDGSKQVTYNGMPLYYYNQDVNPGDTNGQGRANVWFVVNP